MRSKRDVRDAPALEKKLSLLKKRMKFFSIEEEAHKSSRLRLGMSACY
jgi:hypothetical protein